MNLTTTGFVMRVGRDGIQSNEKNGVIYSPVWQMNYYPNGTAKLQSSLHLNERAWINEWMIERMGNLLETARQYSESELFLEASFLMLQNAKLKRKR